MDNTESKRSIENIKIKTKLLDMKVAIIGSRTATNIDMSKHIDSMPSAIISGGAKGVDSIAAKYAIDNNIRLIEYKPDYAKYGRAATFVRNRQIVDNADMIIAFWDGKSHGTKYSINYAKSKNKSLKILFI